MSRAPAQGGPQAIKERPCGLRPLPSQGLAQYLMGNTKRRHCERSEAIHGPAECVLRYGFKMRRRQVYDEVGGMVPARGFEPLAP